MERKSQPTLFQEDSPANLSPLQEREKEQQMIATSGMKCLELLPNVKPRWVVGENVQGIINIDNGLVLRQVQTDLEAQGFQVQCFLIPASGIGAWHKRNRVWIIANSKIQVGKSRKINHREKLGQFTQFDGSSKDVSNSDSRLRRRRGTIKESGANEIWGFYPTQEEQTGQHIRSKAIGCDAVSGEEDVLFQLQQERKQQIVD